MKYIRNKNRKSCVNNKIKKDKIKSRNNSIREKREYRNGLQHGINRVYFDNGIMKYEIEYLNGKMHGKFRENYIDGSIKIKQEYKNDKYDGIYRYYDQRGYVLCIGNFKNGMRDGVWIYLCVIGRDLRNYITYKKDKKEGLEINMHRGRLRSIGHYHNDKKEGKWNHYDQNGNISYSTKEQ